MLLPCVFLLHPVLKVIDLIHETGEVRLGLALHRQDLSLELFNLLFFLLLLGFHFQYLLNFVPVDLNQTMRGELLLWAI